MLNHPQNHRKMDDLSHTHMVGLFYWLANIIHGRCRQVHGRTLMIVSPRFVGYPIYKWGFPIHGGTPKVSILIGSSMT